MRILLSNDDGIDSHNLHLLTLALHKAGHEVCVVAPAEQHSGAGCGITVHSPLLVKKVRFPLENGEFFNGIAVSGTPADCVILGLLNLLPDFRPDLVISGINYGPNAGQDVFFSGTVGAAAQAAMYGIPALAVSHCCIQGATLAHAEFAVRTASSMDWEILPRHRVYNLNLPDCPAQEIKGIKVCRHSTSWPRLDAYERRISPRGKEYFWMKNPFQHFQLDDEGTDKSWLHQNWATLSALRIDLNDEEAAQKIDENLLWSRAMA